MTATLQVEATGETVGEAKWAALRELERLRPALDKAAVRFQVSPRASAACSVSATRRRGSIATVDRPPRPRAARPPRRRDASWPPTCASCVERIARRDRRRLPGRRRRGRRTAIARHVRRRRPRAADRPPRPDDRRGPVPRERDRRRRQRERAQRGRRRRRGLPRPARARRSRRSRSARAERALAHGERVELEPMTRGRAQGRARAAEGATPASRPRARATEPNRYVVVHPVA